MVSSQMPKTVFQGSQGADPTREFHERPPSQARQVQPCPTDLEITEQAAKNHEQDEKQMKDDNHVGQKTVPHYRLPRQFLLKAPKKVLEQAEIFFTIHQHDVIVVTNGEYHQFR